MQDARQVYRDQVLTDVFLSFPAQNLIGSLVLPTLNVPDLTGLAFKLDESHLTVPIDSRRADFARANRVSFELTDQAYGPLAEHSLEAGITDKVMRTYQTPIVPETNATNVVSRKLAFEKEIYIRNHVTNIANYHTNNRIVLSGAAKLSDDASDPEAMAQAAHEAMLLGCGHRANQVTMGYQVRKRLRNHPKVLATFNAVARVTNEEKDAAIREILDVERIIVSEGIISDQADGQLSGGKSFIWGDDLIFQYVVDTPVMEDLTYGYLLNLNPRHDTEGAPLVGVDKWYEQDKKSTFVRATEFYGTWTVANTAGFLYKDCL
jgi:hypothetical protein